MTTAYTWTFPAFDTAILEDGKANVVKVVHWRLDAADGTFSAGSYGTAAMEPPEPVFTAFEDLTKKMVEGWVAAVLDVDTLKAGLDAQLDALANPVSVTRPAPWANIDSV